MEKLSSTKRTTIYVLYMRNVCESFCLSFYKIQFHSRLNDLIIYLTICFDAARCPQSSTDTVYDLHHRSLHCCKSSTTFAIFYEQLIEVNLRFHFFAPVHNQIHSQVGTQQKQYRQDVKFFASTQRIPRLSPSPKQQLWPADGECQ